uniref:non-specific serine/threonine protein kinase n=1 Tax=Euplotes harpa TaxID=151035 RepID=A0A7S3N9S7_9SPIT|mmetsp:Transcript_27365/g.31537  ORF Transcript_27365/g.31537 Transcript_27365/m.31537 type:complete len:427 (+) Transcript_27365:29-1309(+)
MEPTETEQAAKIYSQGRVNLNNFVVSSNYYGDPSNEDVCPEEVIDNFDVNVPPPDDEGNSDEDIDMEMIEEMDTEYINLVKENQEEVGKPVKDDFIRLKVIGQGSYGKVFLVQHKQTGITYAMKVLQKEDLKKRNQVEHIMAERRILEKIKHPFIVSLQYSFQSSRRLYFVLDYCPGGELFFYLQNIGRFKEKTACFYASNILLGIEELHKQDIIYRDLKPENVLIGYDGYAKITDFGLSKENIKGNNDAHSFCGTPEYLAPEILMKTGHGKAADWWSFGAIIYEMLVGIPPFYTKNRQKLYQNIKSADLKLEDWLSENAKDLLSKLLVKNPSKRLGAGPDGAQEVKNHPFFENISWADIYSKSQNPPYTPQLDAADDVKHFSTAFTKNDPYGSYEDGMPSSLPDDPNGESKWQGFSYDPDEPILQ